MLGRKSVVLSVSVIAILVSSTIFVAIPAVPRASAQAQLPGEQRNWEYINHDSHSTNFNPQTQITKDNVALLELKWLFPMPSASSTGPGLIGITLQEGSRSPPIVVDGLVYLLLQTNTVVALDAGSGKTVWTYTTKFNGTDAVKKLPIGPL